MYLSLPDIKNSGRRWKQREGVPIYRYPKKGGYLELYEVDNPEYTHKVIRVKNGSKFEVLLNITSGLVRNNDIGTSYQIKPGMSETELLNSFSDLG